MYSESFDQIGIFFSELTQRKKQWMI